MLKFWAGLLICAAMAAGGVSAEETTTSAADETEDTRAIKVKTRTQKLADACGVFDEARPSCQNLRKACNKPVNNEKSECTALPAEEAATTEETASTEQTD